MTSITILTIVVVALLTLIIFGLAWLGYSSCIKAYRVETEAGKHDQEILKEFHSKKKDKKGLIGIICSYATLTALAGLFITGMVYKASGENFTINNQTALVIKSGSMSDFYNEATAQSLNYDKSLQFGVGDVCIFETNFDHLVEGEVYGYKHKNIIITHRLIAYDEINKVCKFKGDNNSSYDGLVSVDNVVYHYTGRKLPAIGAFVLFAQSYFGIWAIIGVVGVIISSEIIYYKIEKINKERYKVIYVPEEKQEIRPSKKIKARFRRRDGTLVTIYEKSLKGESKNEK